MKWHIEYYTNPDGKSPIKDFIDSLPLKAKARTVKSLDLLESYGIQMGEPHVKNVGRKLWELRVKAEEGIFRFFFTVKKNRIIILLHGFQKKSERIPKRELGIAIRRMKEIV